MYCSGVGGSQGSVRSARRYRNSPDSKARIRKQAACPRRLPTRACTTRPYWSSIAPSSLSETISRTPEDAAFAHIWSSEATSPSSIGPAMAIRVTPLCAGVENGPGSGWTWALSFEQRSASALGLHSFAPVGSMLLEESHRQAPRHSIATLDHKGFNHLRARPPSLDVSLLEALCRPFSCWLSARKLRSQCRVCARHSSSFFPTARRRSRERRRAANRPFPSRRPALLPPKRRRAVTGRLSPAHAPLAPKHPSGSRFPRDHLLVRRRSLRVGSAPG